MLRHSLIVYQFKAFVKSVIFEICKEHVVLEKYPHPCGRCAPIILKPQCVAQLDIRLNQLLQVFIFHLHCINAAPLGGRLFGDLNHHPQQ